MNSCNHRTVKKAKVSTYIYVAICLSLFYLLPLILAKHLTIAKITESNDTTIFVGNMYNKYQVFLKTGKKGMTSIQSLVPYVVTKKKEFIFLQDIEYGRWLLNITCGNIT